VFKPPPFSPHTAILSGPFPGSPGPQIHFSHPQSILLTHHSPPRHDKCTPREKKTILLFHLYVKKKQKTPPTEKKTR
jgi:hypothetical protein